MSGLVARTCFAACLAVGRLLRSARYSTVRLVRRGDSTDVRKRRAAHAPVLVWMNRGLMSAMASGVRVLPQQEWEDRECLMYERLYGVSIQVENKGTLVLPHLAGQTLASLLDAAHVDAATRKRAIQLAVLALADFHREGFTHGDAMADNVMVDLEKGVARWFDFETVHDPALPVSWRHADDLRALLATCALRIPPDEWADVIGLLRQAYPDRDILQFLVASFTPILCRPLAFHLGQAPLSSDDLTVLGSLLRTGLRPY